jgi:hypothetical protein
MSQSGSREILILGSGAAGKHLARHVAAIAPPSLSAAGSALLFVRTEFHLSTGSARLPCDLPPSVGFGRRDAVMVNKVPDSSSC